MVGKEKEKQEKAEEEKHLLVGERVIITNKELADELEKKGIGEKEDKQLLLSPEEALYLKEKRKRFPIENARGKDLTYKELFKYFMRKDKEFGRKYLVYRDLKDRGFCVRTGFKFGTHYRVYSRGDRPGKGHAIWLVHCVPEEYKAEMPIISRSIRLAQNVRKKMIYAVIDTEGDITYYKFDRITP